MTQLADEVLRLQRGGWIVRRADTMQSLPSHVILRYPWIPKDIQAFLCTYTEIIRADEKAWLLLAPDFNGTSQSAYRWNEWELQCYDATKGDAAWREEIQAFWNEHLPIAFSVSDGYAYHALRPDGSVVAGREPEFEDTWKVADSFEQFLQQLT